MTCITCGREDEHAGWCPDVRRAARERSEGKAPQDWWPWWMEEDLTHALHDFPHGTEARYKQERRLGLPTCRPCRNAHNVHGRTAAQKRRSPAT